MKRGCFISMRMILSNANDFEHHTLHSAEPAMYTHHKTKTKLVKHITQHDPKLKMKILGVETVDHPTDWQIIAYARVFFKPTHFSNQQIRCHRIRFFDGCGG